ncbi:hypothetical protein JM83_1895 [Gillisia sp. Hel_I_86]|uniref:universal stress protein n=1 Tax=Gillisia sp. Hel_I_86 TaxID=1249981 RepID=UPI00119B0FB0|nr:hypothetical protein [Gillisia sp. Hel_I_86]TVZ26896.1 hypothetical protein JM83_1895 [Gillisia sp. Hel_I_86]
MKNILIPINFSFHSYDAIDYAIKFFKEEEECHFYFLNTFTIDIDGLNAIELLQADEDWFENPKNESEKNLGFVIQKYLYKNRGKNHQFSAISDCTNLIQGIKKVIEEIEIDLVVIPGKKNTNDTNEEYSKNTKRVIGNIRECPLMIIPPSARILIQPEFVLVSNFEEELSKTEIQKWYKLVKAAKGTIKIVTLFEKDKMTSIQKTNQNWVRLQIEMYSTLPIKMEHVDTFGELEDLVGNYSNHIICLIDKKPGFWRMLGLNNSRITKLGPSLSTPLIALHS